jgi:formylglycine-generating enzyme required for sulfatase activity
MKTLVAVAAIVLLTFTLSCKNDTGSPTAPSDAAPTACATVDPESGPLDTSFAFDASCSSDAEDELASLVFRWDWTGNGSFDTELTGTVTATHQFAATGIHDTILEVEDTAGNTDRDTLSVTVNPDLPPVACVETVVDTGTLSTLFSFDATCSTDAEDIFSDITFRWDWEGDGVFDEEGGGHATTTHQYTSTGVFEMILEVLDTIGQADRDTVIITVELGIDTVSIPAGGFTMGSGSGEPGHYAWEVSHPVALTYGFIMFAHPVTEMAYDLVMGSGQSVSMMPRGYVDWDEAVVYCNVLSALEGLTPAYTINAPNGDVTWNHDADGWRLPTEAEWEYACRAGSEAAFPGGQASQLGCAPVDPVLDDYGWYCGNTFVPQEVGQKLPNDWGLHDMHGSLYEWCWDGYLPAYETLSMDDPVYDVEPGANRTCRGGSWQSDTRHCRAAYRGQADPDNPADIRGFRPVRTVF